ncbi:sigma-54 dependent transcriptional regulator [Stappia stellulata]|uniref:sigma-54-dependent transcriptional regulator n=1 Tax=Stappia stellulata TaxID=71235 RepID=UPI001CD7FDE7|nr:sigma-54 dependent transcriptional regulator [Stappia stellulata]MCA1243984.1 sigma-54 dependent transcriptional regulator [Stappia stellulata]
MVLLVEDTRALAETYQAYLAPQGWTVRAVETAAAAKAAFEQAAPAVVVLDVNLPDGNGLDLLRWIKARDVPCEVVVITGTASINMAVESMREGAFDFVMKPFSADRLRVTLRNAIDRQMLTNRLEALGEEMEGNRFEGMIGRSFAMQTVYRILRNAAPTNATVFITGESGTGKELCAHALHSLSRRAMGPLISINCAAIPSGMLESEIFGHSRGAFTGALSDRRGAVLSADGGTLFLDEVCEMDLDLQSKMLRVLQEKTVQRVGEDTPQPVDVRIVCATNRDPEEEVAAGRFREDLYYRLHVVPVELPPLRERDDDVLLIAREFLKMYSSEDGKRFRGFTRACEDALLAYSWPGNIRQLQNTVRRAVVLNDAEFMEADMLPLTRPQPQQSLVSDAAQIPSGLDAPEGPAAGGASPQAGALQSARSSPSAEVRQASAATPVAPPNDAPAAAGGIEPLETVIRSTIERAVALCDGNIPRAANALKVSPSTLYRRIQMWGQDGEDDDPQDLSNT